MIKKCVSCGAEFDAVANTKRCLACRDKVQLPKPKTCAICGIEFDGHGNAKYCLLCRDKIHVEKRRESDRNRRYAHLKKIYEERRRRYREIGH